MINRDATKLVDVENDRRKIKLLKRFAEIETNFLGRMMNCLIGNVTEKETKGRRRGKDEAEQLLMVSRKEEAYMSERMMKE